MLKKISKDTRLSYRNLENGLVTDLHTRYNLPIAAAEKLVEELKVKLFLDSSLLKDGEIYYHAIDASEPAGKPLKSCKLKRIKLTLLAKEDLEIERQKSLRYLRYVTISRLCWQAYRQGGLLTQEDLSRLLRMSVSAVKKILRTYRDREINIPTRGGYHDIGPSISHKGEAVKMYLSGLTLTDISFRLHHDLSSIERYIQNFIVVFRAHEDGYGAERIAHMSKISAPLVRTYISIYNKFKGSPSEVFLSLIRARTPKLKKRGPEGVKS